MNRLGNYTTQELLSFLEMDYPRLYREFKEAIDYRYGCYIIKDIYDDVYWYNSYLKGYRRLMTRPDDIWDYDRCQLEFTYNFAHLCVWNDIPDYELARISGISEQTLSSYSNASYRKAIPNYESLLKMCNAFECRIEDFTDERWLGNDAETEYKCDMNPENFKDKLRWAMEELKLNQEALSKISGISQQTISNYLNGKTRPNLYKLILLSRSMDIPIRLLVE